MIRVFRSGRHAHRSPLAYPALAPLFADEIKQVGRPEDADLYLFAHVIDVEEAPEAVVLDWRARRRPVVVLSEEPFWDTIWGGRPLDPLIYLDTAWGALPVHQLCHTTSDIFRFDRLPYYLLTDHRFANAYRHRFGRNAQRKARDWQQDFAARPLDAVFMFERRPEPYHAVRWGAAGLEGLCSWRTEFAEACPGRVARLGRSWQGGTARQALAQDWHLDKLVALDGGARMMGALENTHQHDYITEKIFDAFACGALPLYSAATRHRLHGFHLPPKSWINLHGMSPARAAAEIAAFDWEPEVFDHYAFAQHRLRQLFSQTGLWVAERARLRQAVLDALRRILDQGS